ncbi:PREDICTED: SET and MYND domain-containing protein 4 isoform X1 [Cyprinodon variegatus]|uniref:Protein-lysine N-methyltransferase SMYD4 n=1 Tax=Cyprinodon variegatus TaxID=28743 RepID=A0A3Q2FV56_CYPVA|nr:PREDICTED: SET and MYND domain-containing protein 4 isoform X1 [Cyprinodon variegatus]
MMDLPCTQWQDHVAQKWSGLDPKQKETFNSLREIDDVFKCALSLANQEDLDAVQLISAGYLAKKDSREASKCRERGNCSFKAKDYKAAALHYSQGICFAPPSSEQLSLCYANRSAALYHLQHYQTCLDDINRALNNGYPPHLSYKLQDRRTLCLSRLSVCEKTIKDPLSASANDDICSQDVLMSSNGAHRFGICPKVSVGCSEEKGCHLVALKKITAGEVILSDRPFSLVLIPGTEKVKGKKEREQGTQREMVLGTEHRRCHRCLAETLCPVACEGCSLSQYCSAACQQEAWEEHHQWECPLGADLTVMGLMAQLALRITLKARIKNIQIARRTIRDEQKMKEKYNPYLTVFHLLHHLEHQSAALRFLFAVTVATLYLKLSKAAPLPIPWKLNEASSASGGSTDAGDTESSPELWVVGSAVLRHMLQLRCNAQAVITLQEAGSQNSQVQSVEEIRIATAMFPTLSLLNHSCCPNTSLVFGTGKAADPCVSQESAGFNHRLLGEGRLDRGVTVTVRAARVITPGEQVLHCYGPHSNRMRTRERQHLLQQQYFFLCECEACSIQEDQRKSSRKDSGLLCSKCKGALIREGGSGFTCSSLTCGHQVSAADVNERLQEVRAALEKAVELMERDVPVEALHHLQRTRSQSGFILGEIHPLQGELADATARAYAAMGDWRNAATQLEQSTVATASQYGKDSLEVGQQLFKLAQLHFNGGARGPALSVMSKVKPIFSLHCGPNCPELQELNAMEECLQGLTF